MGRRRKRFDPIQLERELVAAGALEESEERENRQLGTSEAFFTEGNERLWCLWRIMLVRQLHPEVLRSMTDSDLAFVAGHSPEGYDALGSVIPEGVINHAENKVAQNAKRAGAELERRSRRAGVWQQAVIGVGAVVVGVVLGARIH